MWLERENEPLLIPERRIMCNLALAIESPPLVFVLFTSLTRTILQTCDGVAIENERDVILSAGITVLNVPQELVSPCFVRAALEV